MVGINDRVALHGSERPDQEQGHSRDSASALVSCPQTACVGEDMLPIDPIYRNGAKFSNLPRISSIVPIVSADSFTPDARTFSSICEGFVAPISAELTPSWRSTHASASWDSVRSSSCQ